MDLPLRASARRLLLLSVLAAVIGSLAGLAAYALIHLIALLTNMALFGRVGWKLPSFRTLDPSPRLVIAPVIGALAVAGLAKWSPIIRGHGIPEAMEAILRKQSRIAPRTAVAKPLSAAIAIGTGGPFGAEGPIIVTGGAIGSLIGQVIDVSPSERQILLASGAAPAVAIATGLFAIEHGFRRLPFGAFWHPALGAVFFGVVGLVVPRALGVGYDAIDDALGGHLAVSVLAGLLIAKLLAWWVAL